MLLEIRNAEIVMPLVMISYLMTFAAVVCVAFALMPSQDPKLPRLPAWNTGSRERNPFTPLLHAVGKLVPASQRNDELVGRRLLYAASLLNSQQFWGLKLVVSLACGFAGFVVIRGSGSMSLVWALGGAAVGFMVPEIWLNMQITKRHEEVLRLLPEVIDLLALCVGAGLDFLGALNKAVLLKTFRRKREPLLDELSIVLQEIKLGRRRFEALKDMAKRINLPELSSFVRTLVLADRMGTPINEVLTMHAEDVRFERYQRAERMALKAPIKILFPLIFFIMPVVAIVVAGPVILQFIRMNPFQGF